MMVDCFVSIMEGRLKQKMQGMDGYANAATEIRAPLPLHSTLRRLTLRQSPLPDIPSQQFSSVN